MSAFAKRLQTLRSQAGSADGPGPLAEVPGGTPRAAAPGRSTPTGAPPAVPERDPLETPSTRLEIAHTRASLRERLALARRTRRAARARSGPEELAALLEGALTAPGLVAIERTIPWGSTHGRSRLAPCEPEHLDYFGAGDTGTREVAFIDTETTGLAGGTGTVVFLLGLARCNDAGLGLTQLLVTSFSGERTMLQAAAELLDGVTTLISFNGKSFDRPLLSDRCRLANVGDPFVGLAHLDLLHPTRRAYAGRWPNCRLGTAELELLGLRRTQDLPGSLAPYVWFDWMRSARTEQMPALVRHNRLDLVSLAALLPALHRAYVEPYSHDADPLACSRHLCARGRENDAYRLLGAHRARLNAPALLELARLARRRKDWSAALEAWHALAEQGHVEATEHLAKYYEHRGRDLVRALALTESLIEIETRAARHRERATRLLTKLDRPC